MIYRRRAGPLQSARAAAGCAYCLALAAAALIVSNPVVLAAIALAVLAAGQAAGVGRELRRAAVIAIPAMAAIAAVNALVARNGLTVIVRLGTCRCSATPTSRSRRPPTARSSGCAASP